MTTDELPHPGQGSGKTFAEPIPPALLDTPLEYLLVDHFRQRSLCAAMRRLSEAEHVDCAEADMIVAYLARDLGLHHRDEEEDLFPRLLRRVLPEDDLAPAIAHLAESHRQSQPMVETLIAALAGRPGGDTVKLAPATRKLMRAYAASEQHHLAAENGIVLAIARIRLRRADLKAMSRTMKDRRGVPG